MFDTTEQILTGLERQPTGREDAFCEIQETVRALFMAAAELSMTDPEGARFVIVVARKMAEEKESAPVSVARRHDV